MSPVDWSLAVCLGSDTEMWFRDTTSSDDKTDIALAVVACKRCPIRAGCLDAALREEKGRGRDYRFGVRGGLTPGQRYSRATRRPGGAEPKQQRVA